MYVLYATIQNQPPGQPAEPHCHPVVAKKMASEVGKPSDETPKWGSNEKHVWSDDARNVMILNCFRPSFETILNLKYYCYSNWPLPG